MKAALLKFYETYKYGLPVLILFLTSLCMPAAGHRVVFYLLTPCLFAMLYRFRSELPDYAKTRSFAFLALYLGYFLLSFFASPQADINGILKEIQIGLSILVFTLSLAVAIPKIPFSPNMPVYFALICLAASVAYALYFYIPRVGLNSRMPGMGRYQNSIHFSFLLSFAIIGIICLWLIDCKKQMIYHGSLILALLFFIALSQTRSAYVALAACILFFGVLGHLRLAIILSALLAVITLVIYCVWDTAFAHMFNRLDSYRLDIWREAYEAVLTQKWFGHGLLAEPHFNIANKHSNGGWKSTHNAFLGHAFSGGLVGLGIYIMMIANMTWIAAMRFFKEKKNKRRYSYLTLLSCLLLCYTLCASLFNFTHYIVNVHIQWLVFWVPFAMIWYIEVSEKRLKAGAYA